MRPVESLLAEALDLPEQDRAQLALRLAESLMPSPPADAQKAWADEITRRVQRLREGSVETIPGRAAIAAARAHLAARRA